MGVFPSPRLEALFARAREIWADRGEIQQRFGQIESLGYWLWLTSTGMDEYPELREFLPVPPPELIGRVVGHYATPEFFHASGFDDAGFIYDRLVEGGFDPARARALLDFGCGCGRLMRFFARFADSIELHGADPDSAPIEWCRKNLDMARYEVLGADARTPYASAQFDGIYAFSVFSHLPEDLHLRWLEELHRITKVGGVVVLTTMGQRCIDVFAAGGQTKLPALSPERLRAGVPTLENKGFAYFPYDHAIDSLPDEINQGALYGLTFILEHYIRANWLDRFDLVALHQAPQEWQDYAVLARR